MNNIPIRIAISGPGGRMGRQLIHAVRHSTKAILTVMLSRDNSTLSDIDATPLTHITPLKITLNSDLHKVKDDFDILIDFTRPTVSLMYLDFCQRYHKGIVIGTTGFSDEQKEIIRKAAKKTGIVFAANFSVGVNLMLKLLEKTSKVIGNNADIEIIETHHRHKVDAPSGTALAMGKVIADTLGRDLAHYAVYSRIGDSGERKEQSIGFSTVRAGDIVGEHTVMFAEIGERLEITHKASSRMTFARGAVCAALWLSKQQKGLFDMINVLNLDTL
ncbi:4-hydroxy-tetrahydrodipicolinate reductase [Candidatus Steffania adelgidicola]|uniref:4-hydroxy-tetrahydrodipicolinate reductase n=1 Tax=Candidatus Steffania adelgidicola TaxID=1076626 RepID=UPI001D01FE98|nr:4-hydroxy-tetrahydrodipicolinate reductase [Candidatus Steffania adelgidicola]UDG80228.1 4-hydroxy-tetrahydrodipicolinate reductase [Candidatus Steffania adelgidicola]